MNPFTSRVIDIIKSIPEGAVMTYGQIAELAGSRRGARQVVRILHAMSERYALPWHRVVNAKGEIAVQDELLRGLQAEYLQSEGVDVDDLGRLDLNAYRFVPAKD